MTLGDIHDQTSILSLMASTKSMSNGNIINAIPEYDKHIAEAETFLQRLTDNKRVSDEWHALWKSVNLVSIRLASLERKWKGFKKATGISPIQVIRQDVDGLVHKLEVNISKDENAIEWGIKSTQSLIDMFPTMLPYFKNTNFAAYVEEIASLLEKVTYRTKHSEVIRLLREVREHPDIVVIGQFCTNEMVGYYKCLVGNQTPNDRGAIINYIDIYQKLCSIYGKDMVLCYCLLLLWEKGDRPSYGDAHPERRHPQNRINFVTSRISLFGYSYSPALRNASAHTDIETDSKNRIVTIYPGRNKPPEHLKYDKVVSLTRDMSALVAAFRLLPAVLANNDWKALGNILQ